MNLNVLIFWAGVFTLSILAIYGIAAALKGAGKNPNAQTSILWGGWGLGVATVLFGSELGWLRSWFTGRATQPAPAATILAICLIGLTIAVALMARNGFTAAEFAATILGGIIMAIGGWVTQESSRTIVGLAATVGVQLVWFGAGNAQAKLAAKESRLGNVAAPAGWLLTLAGLAAIVLGIFVANGGNTAGWLPKWQWRPNTTADGRTARGTAGPKITPPPPLPTAQAAPCYKPNADRSAATFVVPGRQPKVHPLQGENYVRAMLGLTIPATLEPGGSVVYLPRCPIAANDPP